MSIQGIKPLISVVMITYKHEAFLAEAIEGVLMQEVDFEVELIIADDCSPDGTQDIVNHYIENHPKGHWIKYHQHEKNIGMMPNFIFALKEAKGKYIALCEGDDYWIDPYKLQKQVDFLEENPDYSVCFHMVQILNESTGKLENDSTHQIPETTSIIDLAKGNFIHTPSVVYRNSFIMFDPIFNTVPAGDYLIHMLNARKGLIKKLNDTMAVYRLHDQGVWSSQNQITINKRWIKQMNLMIPLFQDLPNVIKELKAQRIACIRSCRNNIGMILFLRKLRDFITYRLYRKWIKN